MMVERGVRWSLGQIKVSPRSLRNASGIVHANADEIFLALDRFEGIFSRVVVPRAPAKSPLEETHSIAMAMAATHEKKGTYSRR